MTASYENLARCIDLQEAHIADAVVTRESTRLLLSRLASVSAPDSGAAKVLFVYARMATTACDWIDGDLCIDLIADGTGTIIEACTELGGGLRERLFPALRFAAPMDEFARAIARVPHMIAPLRRRAGSSRRIALSAAEMVRRTTAPPPPIDIAEDSLFLLRLRSLSGENPTSVEDESLSGALPVLGVGRDFVQQAPAAVGSDSPPKVDEIDAGWEEKS